MSERGDTKRVRKGGERGEEKGGSEEGRAYEGMGEREGE